MTPPASGAARLRAPRPAPEAEAPTRRPPLRVVDAPARRARPRRRRTLELLALAAVVVSLVAVVVGHAVLAEGQVRLTSLQQQLTAEQATNRQLDLSVAGLETPSRIVSEAEQQGHMVTPASVQQVPSVPLTTPVAAPKVTPAPSTPTTTPAPATSSGTSTSTAPSTATATSTGTAPATTTPSTP